MGIINKITSMRTEGSRWKQLNGAAAKTIELEKTGKDKEQAKFSSRSKSKQRARMPQCEPNSGNTRTTLTSLPLIYKAPPISPYGAPTFRIPQMHAPNFEDTQTISLISKAESSKNSKPEMHKISSLQRLATLDCFHDQAPPHNLHSKDNFQSTKQCQSLIIVSEDEIIQQLTSKIKSYGRHLETDNQKNLLHLAITLHQAYERKVGQLELQSRALRRQLSFREQIGSVSVLENSECNQTGRTEMKKTKERSKYFV